MEYKELEMLQGASVGWSPYQKKWYSSGELRLPEYEVNPGEIEDRDLINWDSE